MYIELPAEDEQGGPDQLGKLNLSLYGTRDAAKNWQEHLSRHLTGIGFVRGVGHTSVYRHPKRQLMVLVHGDDYVASGEPNDQKWLKDELEKAYQTKTQVLGPGGGKEGTVLNRVVAWSKAGWTYEADPRHAELIQEQLGIKTGGGITTAGAAEDGHKDEDDLSLEGRDITLFRGLAARTNYLAMDRPDLQFAAK